MAVDTSPIQHSLDAIKKIEASCRIVAETLALVGKSVKPGVATSELDAIAEDYIRTKGGVPAFKGYKVGPHVFPSTLCISVEDAVVHGIPGDHKLNEGEIVSIDCGVKKDGYFGDSAYTFAVGEVSDEKKKLMRVTQEALNKGVEQAVARKKIYHISGAVQRHVEKHGFSVVRDLVGHGIGTELHAEPSVPNFVPPLLHRSHFPNVKLVEGMAIAIEPMVNAGVFDVETDADEWTIRTVDGMPSAHYEHTVIVQAGEPLILTLQ